MSNEIKNVVIVILLGASMYFFWLNSQNAALNRGLIESTGTLLALPTCGETAL